MMVLSVHQPRASLVMWGEKLNETRGWRTHYRGPFAIHASKGRPAGWRDLWRPPFSDVLRDHLVNDLEELPRGCILGVVTLLDCVQVEPTAPWPAATYARPTRRYLTVQERAFGDYSAGRWAWLLADPRPLQRPIVARGAQGLWRYQDGPILRELALTAATVAHGGLVAK